MSPAASHARAPRAIRRLLLCAVLLVPGTLRAAPLAARVHWQPSPDQGVTGYRVYARLLNESYGTPYEASLPAPEGDGTLTAIVSGLDFGRDYAFAVTAYLQNGSESGFSNELRLLAGGQPETCGTDADCADADACTTSEGCSAGICVRQPASCPQAGPCAEAVCDPLTGCGVRSLADGSPCDSGDPCASGVCTAGECAAVPEAGPSDHELRVRTFVLKRVGGRRRIIAKGSFAAPEGFDPTLTGGTVDVRAEDGTSLYTLALPGSAFSPGNDGTSFRYVAPQPGGHGREKLVLALHGHMAAVTMKGMAETVPAPGSVRLAWSLRLGEICMRDPDISCRGMQRRISPCR